MLQTTISFVMSVCLPVYLSLWNNLAPTGRIFMKFYMRCDPEYSWLVPPSIHQEDCAQIICPNRPNCEFRVLLRSFAATAWKRAKTSSPTLARTDLAASPWQRPVSHFRLHPPVSGENKIAVIPHPPYSPDLAPCDFFLFPKLKLKLKGRRFVTTEGVQAESQRVLDTQREKDFQEAFQKWRRRWDQCLHAEGNYFEGDDGR